MFLKLEGMCNTTCQVLPKVENATTEGDPKVYKPKLHTLHEKGPQAGIRTALGLTVTTQDEVLCPSCYHDVYLHFQETTITLPLLWGNIQNGVINSAGTPKSVPTLERKYQMWGRFKPR